MSSSMRNAIQRRSHRERAQPLERQRLGLLEKHKDYRLRARDWAKKKATLQSLREKAAERNEDEFSYKMISRGRGPGTALTRGSDEKRDRHWTGTVDGSRGNSSLSIDTVRLLKTQDTGYLRTARNMAAKAVARLETRAALATSFAGGRLDDVDDDEDDDAADDDDEDETFVSSRKRRTSSAPAPTKIVFADSATSRDAAVLARTQDDDANDDEKDNTQNAVENAARLQRRLVKARRRLQALTDAEHELDLQRARMAKTPTVNVQTKKGRVIKARERKR